MDGNTSKTKNMWELVQEVLESTIAESVENSISKSLEKVFKQQTLKEAQNDTLLSRKELSERLGISYVTIHKRMNDGTLPYVKLGRRVYYKLGDVIKEMEGRKNG